MSHSTGYPQSVTVWIQIRFHPRPHLVKMPGRGVCVLCTQYDLDLSATVSCQILFRGLDHIHQINCTQLKNFVFCQNAHSRRRLWLVYPVRFGALDSIQRLQRARYQPKYSFVDTQIQHQTVLGFKSNSYRESNSQRPLRSRSDLSPSPWSYPLFCVSHTKPVN